ncbi:MAG: hypothetical protein JWR08_2530 [Enterovirga sp.]|jgi:cell pole-organizing protein PopZ|nr:hypothetical protein [Enterovirga sp.]
MSAASAKTQEPSMEEILASIRRIIADDQDSPKSESTGDRPVPRGHDVHGDDEHGHAALGGGGEAAPEPAPSRGPLAEIVAAGRVSPELEVDVPDDISFPETIDRTPPPEEPAVDRREPSAAVAPHPKQRPVEPPKPTPPGPESLISHEATASVGEAFDMLSHTVLSRNARTLEDLVKELLKPMLKTWLDDNLPPLVERLVRAEIERVARGRH